ncbi:dUTP diphosphatase, partial [Jeotgalibaca porci]|uniref:dUTP diphosphatase n=1 Tax=Jeotgalibaca porci TaxID=1868793 RepID=UPI0035A15863
MQLKIKRLTKTARLPEKAFTTEAGFDIFTDQEIMIESNQTVAISTGIALEIPEGHYGRLKGRSGLTLKSPLRVLEGTIDLSYRGEIKVMVEVKKDCVYYVPKGMKIAQLIIQPLPQIELLEVDELSQSDRGENGFGSTGV